MTRTQLVTIATAVAGIAIWVGVSSAAGVREAWDHHLYWTVGYPLLALVSAVAGFLADRTAMRVPMVLAASQCAAMIVQNAVLSDASFSLLPLGMIVFAIMSLPLFIPAYLGAGAARYLARR